ncbi:hypothetical protein [Leminorella grimontii]|nr:hypothetical protein [Leminorella grimontii]KFC97776.1 hypothetical protein GLGR_0190 [Leminorella grimontii ATCC 33999 = DSM 5078]VFS56367.1 Uncharacterised protein [Leminorella grimontii]
MSSALKALKKLHKKALKQDRKAGDRALRALSHGTLPPVMPIRQSEALKEDSVWGEVSQQVVGAMLGEVAKPLKPLLEWFDYHEPSWPSAKEKIPSARGAMRPMPKGAQSPSILRLPLKSPPCKRCPARSGGICQCAAKRFG